MPQGSLPTATSTGGVVLSPYPTAGTLPAGKHGAIPLYWPQGTAQLPLPFQLPLSLDPGAGREGNVPQGSPLA